MPAGISAHLLLNGIAPRNHHDEGYLLVTSSAWPNDWRGRALKAEYVAGGGMSMCMRRKFGRENASVMAAWHVAEKNRAFA